MKFTIWVTPYNLAKLFRGFEKVFFEPLNKGGEMMSVEITDMEDFDFGFVNGFPTIGYQS